MNYYIDPINGDINNDGSSERPFDTLANVFKKKMTFSTGSTIYLRRGYHGMPVISGKNSANITIVADNGHTPLVGSLIFMNAEKWIISGLTVTRSSIPKGHSDAMTKNSGITIDTQTNENSHYITIQNCSLYSTQNTTGWTEKNWKNCKCGITVHGSNHRIYNNHINNGSGMQFMFHANNCYVGYNVIENIPSDGMGNRGNSNIFEFNIIRNINKVSGNHNDLFQVWSNNGTIIRNNKLVAYTDPKKTILAKPGVSDVQGIGMFDGWYSNMTVENNQVYVDHPIGIWLEGCKNCIVRNNFVKRCGKSTFMSRLPCVRIGPKKSGAVSTGNVVTNNFAENFELIGTGTFSNNTKISGTTKPPVGMVMPEERSMPLFAKKALLNNATTDGTLRPVRSREIVKSEEHKKSVKKILVLPNIANKTMIAAKPVENTEPIEEVVKPIVARPLPKAIVKSLIKIGKMMRKPAEPVVEPVVASLSVDNNVSEQTEIIVNEVTNDDQEIIQVPQMKTDSDEVMRVSENVIEDQEDIDEDNIFVETTLTPVYFKLTVTSFGADLSWNSVKNANGYYIYYKNEQVARTMLTSFMLIDLTDPNVFNYKVVPFLIKY